MSDAKITKRISAEECASLCRALAHVCKARDSADQAREGLRFEDEALILLASIAGFFDHELAPINYPQFQGPPSLSESAPDQ
jgi:hypothetical protein